jgi:fluoride exporter
VTAAVWTAVAALGGVGAVARFLVDAAVATRLARAFPWGTLAVNLSGAFVLGVLAGGGVRGDALLLAGTGTLGAYTTFSTWMFESIRLAEDGSRWPAVVNVAGSLAAGLAAVAIGRAIGEAA